MSTGFHNKDDELFVDSIALSDIAESIGTPTYVYAASVIRDQYSQLRDSLDKALPQDRQPMICYACKANTNLAILKLLHSMGCGLEIVSEGELKKGLLAGFTGNQIISTSYGKIESEVRACLESEIHQFNVECVPELYKINDIASQMSKVANVLFRLNPDISGGEHEKTSTGRKRDKFGLGKNKIIEIYDIARDLEHVNPVGLSVHIGSQVFNVEAFKPTFEIFADMVKTLRNKGHTVTRLDIGGGFPIQYQNENLLDLNQYASWVNEFIVPLETEIQMEPGRYLSGGSGALLSEVIYIKETSDQKFLVTDAGMNDLIRPTLYEAYHGISPIMNLDRPSQTYDVVGPICETGDTFARGRKIPEIKDGEFVIFETAGAYGFSMASNYNSRPLPAEVLVDGDQMHVIRPRQSFEDMIKGEAIPKEL